MAFQAQVEFKGLERENGDGFAGTHRPLVTSWPGWPFLQEGQHPLSGHLQLVPDLGLRPMMSVAPGTPVSPP